MGLLVDSFFNHTDAIGHKQFLEVFDLSDQLTTFVGVLYHDALGTQFNDLGG